MQQIVAGWRGAQRSQQLSVLHEECLNAAGPGGRHLLPAYLLFVKDLDETNLRVALQKANGRLRGTDVRFRVRVAGRFDAVLVPFGPTGEPPERWLLAIEENLPIRDQVALYGHALGHLLLNREQTQLGQLPPLDPHDGYSHRDTLAELRLLEAVRQRIDRRVLETYPLLTALLEEQEALPAALDTMSSALRQRLARSGWRGSFVAIPYVFTNGRVYIRGTTIQHGKKLRIDALLRAEASLPIAAVQTIHAGQKREEVIQRLIEYAHQRLAVPFAYLLDEDGTILGEATSSRDVVFATYQAIADNKEHSGLYWSYPRDFFDVIIVDECHRGSAQADSRWRTILKHFESAVQVGLTATPLSNEAVQTDEYFGKPIYTYSLRTGINDGFLAPYRVRYVLMGSTKEQEHHQEAQPTTISGTTATLVARTPIIAQHLAAYLRQTDPLAKTIVFCVDQAHAEQMRAALERTCSEYVMRYAGYIERIVSDEGIEGKRALGRFSTPEERTPVIVTTSRLLSTGVDIPTCKNIVLARPVASIVEFKQIIGRGSRLYEPDKTWFTIIDYAGAIKLFFDSNFDGDPELVEVELLLPQSQQTTNTLAHRQDAEDAETVPATLANTEVALFSTDHDGTAEGHPSITPEGSAEAGAAPDIVEAHPGTPAALTMTTVKENGPPYPANQEAGEATPFTATSTTPLALSAEAQNNTQEKREGPVLPSQQYPPGTTQSGVPGGTVPITPPFFTPELPTVVKHTRNGQTIGVVGEYVYDLGSDGKTLRRRSSYRDFATTALHSLVSTPADLRARWLHQEQRDALRDALEGEGVDLQDLATALHLPGVDPLDLLLHIAFGQQPLTRSERVERLKREHADFFIGTYEQLRETALSPEQHHSLQDSLMGIEKKSMPYLLGVMNLLLHGIEYPNIVEHNALSTNIRQIRDIDRVDVVVTNPPFGGEEERGILNNFPEGMRTAETALLYFQYVMAMLKRPGGRCGIVLPNGFLFGGGVATVVKRQLLTRFNLHTIVRLPNGVFAPYTGIPTNLVFFEACDPDVEEPCTKEIWYYELSLPEGRNSYSKTKPLQFEEFADCIAWWDNREENERAWKVPSEQILANDCNLDIKNPHSKEDFAHLPPEQLVEDILKKELHIAEIILEIKQMLGEAK